MRRSSSRSRPSGRRALPDPIAVAILGGDAARDRVAAALGDAIALVPLARAELAIRDAAGAREAHAAIADGFRLPTILLVDDPHPDLARAAFAAGAAAVLARQTEPRELRAAVEAVAAGLLVVDLAARDAVARAASTALPPLAEPLTPREHEVLEMLAAGLSNRRIADRLHVSENTAKTHVAAVLAKLGADSRTEAVTLALRHGLLYL